jgi:hypothetical protein
VRGSGEFLNVGAGGTVHIVTMWYSTYSNNVLSTYSNNVVLKG